jgi:SAM-dependent methyltransferase
MNTGKNDMAEHDFNASIFAADDRYTEKYQRKYAALFSPGETVLDLGCGRGNFLSLLRERGVQATGVDSFAATVAACRERGLDVIHADVFDFLRTTGQRFDGVFCSHIIEHLPPEAALRFVGELARVLKPGGRCIILTPNVQDLEVLTETFWLDLTHVRPYPARLLCAMLEHAGVKASSSGIDADTRRRMPLRRIWLAPLYILNKLRYGKYFRGGDTFVIGVK